MDDWERRRQAQQQLANLRKQPAKTKPARPESKHYGTNAAIGARFRAPYYRHSTGSLRPLSLGLYEALEECGLLPRKSYPAACLGPAKQGVQGSGRFMCNQDLMCGVCWDRRNNVQALHCLCRQVHGGPVVKFSMSTPNVRDDPTAMRGIRDDFAKGCRDLGFTQQSIFVHTYGDHPWEGPKGHLDGYLGALPGADPRDILGQAVDQDSYVITDDLYQHVKDAWDLKGTLHRPVMHARYLDPTADDFLQDLLSGAKYASRQTFPTLALIAGQLDRYGNLLRLTDVDGVNSHPKRVGEIQTLVNPRRPDGYFPFHDVQDWALIAAEWDKTIGRHRHSRGGKVAPEMAHLLEHGDVIAMRKFWRMRNDR